jgi:1-deoxy-D-xylulose-5-phosphate reductoisomerase
MAGAERRPSSVITPFPAHGGPCRLTVLGATGSVGTSTLDLAARNPDAFSIVALTAQSQVEKLAELARRFRPELVVIGDPARHRELAERLAGSGIATAAGEDALIAAAELPADCVMAAIMGVAGLKPTIRAARRGVRVALANKECLVSAGQIFMDAIDTGGSELLPVDSEHSAVFQALAAHDSRAVERIVLTASGGPFRTWDMDAMAAARPENALKHPNWSMGRKITIDSATMMNKGLEIIEAFHLFPVRVDQLGVVVHPQSIVHCLVSYTDGSVLAQLAMPDMRTPIALALSWPARMEAPTPRLDLAELGQLTFERPDEQRFPALRLAREALEVGGTAPAVLNAANEVAVEAFLDRRIGFLDIAATVAKCLEAADRDGTIRPAATLDDVFAADTVARRMSGGLVGAEGR